MAGGNLQQAMRLARPLPTITLGDAGRLLLLMADDELADPGTVRASSHPLAEPLHG